MFFIAKICERKKQPKSNATLHHSTAYKNYQPVYVQHALLVRSKICRTEINQGNRHSDLFNWPRSIWYRKSGTTDDSDWLDPEVRRISTNSSRRRTGRNLALIRRPVRQAKPSLGARSFPLCKSLSVRFTGKADLSDPTGSVWLDASVVRSPFKPGSLPWESGAL